MKKFVRPLFWWHVTFVVFGLVGAVYEQFIKQDQSAAGWACVLAAIALVGAKQSYQRS